MNLKLFSLTNYFNLENFKKGEPLKPTSDVIFNELLKTDTLIDLEIAFNQEQYKVYNNPVRQDDYENFDSYSLQIRSKAESQAPGNPGISMTTIQGFRQTTVTYKRSSLINFLSNAGGLASLIFGITSAVMMTHQRFT